MSDGCTDCGRKGGCDHRKSGMFAAIDDALASLYPSRRWGERDDAGALDSNVAATRGPEIADRAAAELKTLALHRTGGPDELCDYVYVLCFGRTPSLLEVREGIASPEAAWAESSEDREGGALEELHLRVALSAVAPFAAVQQVSLRMERRGDELVVVEAPRTGVFDALLLPRYQKLVAVLAALDVRNLDFGDMTQPPDGFDDASYVERYECRATVANYLFYPQPAAAVSTAVLLRATTSGGERPLHAPLESR